LGDAVGTLNVQIVFATALREISRKIIVLDFKEVPPEYVLASAAVILALGVSYWLITIQPGTHPKYKELI
jgi:uncharacterized membrane protein (DUF373 family)